MNKLNTAISQHIVTDKTLKVAHSTVTLAQIIVACNFIGFIVGLAIKDQILIVIASINCILFLLPIIFVKQKKYTISKVVVIILAYCSLISYSFILGKEVGVEYGFIVLPLASSVIFNNKSVIYSIIVSSVICFIGIKYFHNFYPGYHETTHPFIINSIIGIAYIALINTLINFRVNESTNISKSLELIVSEQQKTNDELMTKQREIELITDASPACICYVDRSYRYQFNNKTYEKWFGVSSQELKGKFVEEIIGATAFKDTKAKLDRVFQGEKLHYENKIKFQNKSTRYIRSTVIPDIDHNSQIVGCFMFTEDISEIKAKEFALKNANQELKNFAHATSHDLREPLRMIKSFGQLIKRRYKDKVDHEGNEYLNFITDASIRMERLIQDLLEYATTNTNLKETTNISLNDIIQVVKNNLYLKIQETNTEINVDSLPNIVGHYSLITQLFQNLIANGIKFQQKDINPVITIKSEEKDGQYIISIQDNGIGIEEQYHKQIFDIFNRLHNKAVYDGSGIGLATCKKIIALHKGEIWLESTFGQGSTFFLSFPMAPTSDQSNQAAIDKAHELSLN